MIVDNLDVVRVTTMKLETDAPPRVYSHCPLTFAVTLQPVKPEAAERSQVRWRPCHVEGEQHINSDVDPLKRLGFSPSHTLRLALFAQDRITAETYYAAR